MGYLPPTRSMLSASVLKVQLRHLVPLSAETQALSSARRSSLVTLPTVFSASVGHIVGLEAKGMVSMRLAESLLPISLSAL